MEVVTDLGGAEGGLWRCDGEEGFLCRRRGPVPPLGLAVLMLMGSLG